MLLLTFSVEIGCGDPSPLSTVKSMGQCKKNCTLACRGQWLECQPAHQRVVDSTPCRPPTPLCGRLQEAINHCDVSLSDRPFSPLSLCLLLSLPFHLPSTLKIWKKYPHSLGDDLKNNCNSQSIFLFFSL